MSILLFGGSIFPNQSALEDKQILTYLYEFISKRIFNCYECSFEWVTSLFFLLLSIFIFYLIFNHLKGKNKP